MPLQIKLNPEFCTRLISPRSLCERCEAYCPKGAIKIERRIKISADCDACGICLAACPNGAFEEESEGHANISRYVEDLCKNDGNNESIDFFCHKAAGSSGGAQVCLPYLGSITEVIVVDMVSLGVRFVRFNHGDCSTCQMQKGYDLFKESLSASVMFLILAGCANLALETFEDHTVFQIYTKIKPHREMGISRRSLFMMTTSKTLTAAGQLASDFLELKDKEKFATKAPQQAKLSPRRRKLISLLRQINNQIADKSGPNFEVSLKSAEIDPPKCDGCGACVALCPNGALAKKVVESKLLLYFSPWRCTTCQLCKNLCNKKAIQTKFSSKLRPSDFFKRNLAAQLHLSPCSLCTTKIVKNEKNLCASCSKRYFKMAL